MKQYKVKIYCDVHSFLTPGSSSCFPFGARYIFLTGSDSKPLLYNNEEDATAAGQAYIAGFPDWHYEIIDQNKII